MIIISYCYLIATKQLVQFNLYDILIFYGKYTWIVIGDHISLLDHRILELHALGHKLGEACINSMSKKLCFPQ